MRSSYIFTSESVSEGHPDKVSDQISDAVVDLMLSKDPEARVACETLTTTQRVVLAGEIRCAPMYDNGEWKPGAAEEIEKVVRETVREIGYEQSGFHWETLTLENHLHGQSSEIAQGVDAGTEGSNKDEGAGDQGIMFGYACNETPDLMPATLDYSHKILEQLAADRKSGAAPFLEPDAKSQVTLRYEDGKPVAATAIVVSTQHAPGYHEGDKEAEEGILKLVEAMDDYIPMPQRITDRPFLMPIEDVFGIKGRGTVVTGRVERGQLKQGEPVEIIRFGDVRETVATGLEMFHKLLDTTEAGDAVGILLRGVDRDEVERGQVLVKPGSMRPYTRAEAEVYILSREEGGRHTPFFTGYKPQFYIRTSDITGSVELPEGVEMVMPGDNVKMIISLITPVPIEAQMRFAIREGGRTVGSGVITQVLD